MVHRLASVPTERVDHPLGSLHASGDVGNGQADARG